MLNIFELLFLNKAVEESSVKDKNNVKTKKCKNCLRRVDVDLFKCPNCGGKEFIE